MYLLMPVSVLLLALLIFGSAVGLTGKDLRMTTEWVRSEQAAYLAEAGRVLAEEQYEQNPAWRGEWRQVPLGEGTYTVRVTDQGSAVQIESIGENSKAKARRTVLVPR
jgi:hypothetical protein